ncbi:carbamoyltransferase [Candidatus Pelagibacter ubique]|nr:carbamoyltransferase [Candidatus Pelagibacter ubique]
MTSILGISAFYHDSAASLIIDGEIVAAVQEERFSRKKHDPSYPYLSIKYILEENKITLKDIDHIVFFEKPFLKFERLLETYVAFAPKGFQSFAMSMPIWLKEKLFLKRFLFDKLKLNDLEFNEIKKIKFSEHHLSHAASAFYPSKFEESVILTLDGVGEWATTTVSVATNNKIKILKEIHFPHSIGLLYSAFTYYLGFKVNSGEYKVMGLAPYGKPIYADKIKDNLIDIEEDGSFKLNMKYFEFATGLKMTNESFSKLFGEPVRNSEKDLLKKFHMDLASSLQVVTEEIVLKITKSISKEYDINNLCLAGGVALNCVVNGKILKQKCFSNIWIQPAAGDAGGSIGAALAYYYLELKNTRKTTNDDKMKGSFLGPKFDNSTIEKNLLNLGAKFKKMNDDDLYSFVSQKLADEKIVGWFQGRMEFGPRALGGRSIIADPRSSNMQKKLNLKIKFRESFRPFAPSILAEDLKEWFDLEEDSPYMLLVSEIKKELIIKNKDEENLFGIERLNLVRSKIPAVTHVDYSARIQTVHKKTNPRFYNLISKFKEITGCPILVNTSFNIRGEPIVCSIEDAFKCFMGTGLDILVIENFILLKEEQNIAELIDYKSNIELD